MAMSFEALTAQVARSIDAEKSAIALIKGIAEALRNAGSDPVAVEALRVSLETSANDLAAAVVANTFPTP